MKREKYFVKRTEYKSGTVEYRVMYKTNGGGMGAEWKQVEGSNLFYDESPATAFAECMEGKMIASEEFL
jgi:hypothetical protein